MIRVRRIAHASYETPDIERMVAYYTEILGLNLVEREKNTSYLASTLDHHSIVLHKGPAPKCVRLGFQISPNDELGEFERQLAEAGIKTERKRDAEPSIADMVCFEDPKGTILEVFNNHSASGQAFPTKGIIPYKLGHVAFHVADVQAITQFYCDILGFRVSDWMADFFSFLRCSPDHHTINLIGTGQNRHNHTAFELRDWSHLQSACDYLSRNGYSLIWGPGRHGIGHNLFAYHKNPDGLIVELFAELDRLYDEDLGYFEPRPWHADRPQRPKVWPKDISAANKWGIPPPEEMMK